MSVGELDELRDRHERLANQLAEAEDKVRALGRMKTHEGVAVTKLTPELMDEYVESAAVPGNEAEES